MLTCNRSPFELFDPTFTGTLPSPFVLACPEFVTSFFSHSCKTLPPQPLCFDNHLDCGGGGGVLHTRTRVISPVSTSLRTFTANHQGGRGDCRHTGGVPKLQPLRKPLLSAPARFHYLIITSLRQCFALSPNYPLPTDDL